MGKTIKLNSRSPYDDNILEYISKKTYILKTKHCLRAGYIGDKKFVDPAGGPMIIEEEIVQEVGRKVKKIELGQKGLVKISFV